MNALGILKRCCSTHLKFPSAHDGSAAAHLKFPIARVGNTKAHLRFPSAARVCVDAFGISRCACNTHFNFQSALPTHLKISSVLNGASEFSK